MIIRFCDKKKEQKMESHRDHSVSEKRDHEEEPSGKNKAATIIQGKRTYYVLMICSLILFPGFYWVHIHIAWLGVVYLLGLSVLIVWIQDLCHLKKFLRWYGASFLGLLVLFVSYDTYIGEKFYAQFQAIYTIPGIVIQDSGYYETEWTSGGFTAHIFFFLRTDKNEQTVKEAIHDVIHVSSLQKVSDLSLIAPRRPDTVSMGILPIDTTFFSDEFYWAELREALEKPEETVRNSNFLVLFAYDIHVPN